jgi:hypothetical protein
MPQQWFIKTKTGHLGPVSTGKLARLARRGKLKPNMAVSQDAEVWFKANEIAELTFPQAAIDAEVNAQRQSDSRRRDSVQWYVLTKHGVAGPFTHRKLRKLARRGQLDPCVGVSRDRVTWTKAKRVPGLKFPAPVSTVDQPADARPTDAADVLNPPSMLCQLNLPLFTDDEPLQRSLRPRQLTWFGVPARSQALQSRDHSPVDESRPLLNWPPAFVQLRLFEPVESGGQQDSSASGAHIAARQLELRLLINDDPFAVFRRKVALRQLTLFAVDRRSQTMLQDQPQLIDQWPLFHWPAEVVQLRLFDGAASDDRVADAMPTEPPAQPDRTARAEPSAVDSQGELFARWSQIREAEYVRRFGAYTHIARPQDARGAPVDIYVFPPKQHRPITTLVTSGLSNHRMPVPPGRYSPRAELVLYVDEVKPEYVNLLYFLAQGPLRQNKALYYTAAISHGYPPRPIFVDSVLDGFAFLIPGVTADFQIHESTRIADDSLQLLWVVPTTATERKFLAEQGIARFCRLLNQQQHPLAFNPGRRCYATAATSQAM